MENRISSSFWKHCRRKRNWNISTCAFPVHRSVHWILRRQEALSAIPGSCSLSILPGSSGKLQLFRSNSGTQVKSQNICGLLPILMEYPLLRYIGSAENHQPSNSQIFTLNPSFSKRICLKPCACEALTSLMRST